ncbi:MULTISPECIES: putative quinol monooxygenase [Methanocorpusculum]|uniref:Antibiotic biosynthesis monooxygenase n=1 Tax=Methanocorpusculum parvum TaxID=2193 RepID=A0AAX0QA17_9EURY|nr:MULTISPECIES: putative quinol monooxygenase [Methanocorpusculum]MDD3069473.1 putative quinol monooxygenase [Bacilli bacterium]PAV09766.1 antibiotic biosynthesis monooxygenase [Methanocorpusculum parvum]
MITIIAKCTAKKDTVDDLLELALELVQSSRKEKGNVSYDFYQDITSPEKFTFIECWKDQAAIDSHNATPHFKHFVEKTGQIFAGPLDVALFRKLT